LFFNTPVGFAVLIFSTSAATCNCTAGGSKGFNMSNQEKVLVVEAFSTSRAGEGPDTQV
jgi:hypothetical protein